MDKEDFKRSLPLKLVLGLTTLFLALATMMIAFAAMLVLMSGKRLPSTANSNLHKGNMDSVHVHLERDGLNSFRHFVSSTRLRLALK